MLKKKKKEALETPYSAFCWLNMRDSNQALLPTPCENLPPLK